MNFGQIHHIEYYVDDLVRSNEFWSWFLINMGYRKYQEWPDGISWADDSGTYLVFVQVKEQHLDVKNNRQGEGLNHIAFCGKSGGYLEQLHTELTDRKINILKKDERHICFTDPNDFVIEVFVP